MRTHLVTTLRFRWLLWLCRTPPDTACMNRTRRRDESNFSRQLWLIPIKVKAHLVRAFFSRFFPASMIVALAQRGSQTTYSKYLGATALIALLCGELYRRFFRVPKQLQHIPSISYWRFLFSFFIKKESLTSRTQRLVFPLLSQANGLYLVNTMDGIK